MASEKMTTMPSQKELLHLWNATTNILDATDSEFDSKQREDHENRIRRHYSQLLSFLTVPDVVIQMFQIGKLTAKEHEHIRQFYSAPIRASEELLSVIIMSPRDVYECFIESLKKTKQHHVYQMLTSDDGGFCMDDQSLTRHSHRIRQNYGWLTESLDPDSGLLMCLVSKEVLDQRESGRVAFEKDRFARNEMLLSIISRKSVKDFKKFLDALNETLQGHITKRLTEIPVGDTNQNAATTVVKTLATSSSDSVEKRSSPKVPTKPKKQTPTLPSKQKVVIKPRPLQRPTIIPSQPNETEKRENVYKQNIVKKRSKQHLEAKLGELPSELQTEVSTKIFLSHDDKSMNNILMMSLTKLLQESRSIKTHNIMQARARDDNYVESKLADLKQNFDEEKNKAIAEKKQLMTKYEELQQELSGSRSDFVAQQDEFVTMRTENFRLQEQLKESRKIIAEIRYKSEMVLVQTIRTKASEQGKKSIRGLTILDKELFVATGWSSEIEVFDTIKPKLSFSRRWNLKELIDPADIGSCKINKCIYIFDYKDSFGQSKEILRVKPNGELIKKWSTGDDFGRLSVTDKWNVILIVSDKNKLNEYSPNGELIREIRLSSAGGIHHPWHAVKITNDHHFVVSHGSAQHQDRHRVCLVNGDGMLKKSFGGKPGSGVGQLSEPSCLLVDESGFVMVADQLNSRVLLLDQDLEFKRKILSKEGKHGLHRPARILLDEIKGRMFVADNESNNGRVLIFDFA